MLRIVRTVVLVSVALLFASVPSLAEDTLVEQPIEKPVSPNPELKEAVKANPGMVKDGVKTPSAVKAPVPKQQIDPSLKKGLEGNRPIEKPGAGKPN